MRKHYFFILALHLCIGLTAQSYTHAGVVLGSSHGIRINHDQDNPYNYEHAALSLYYGKAYSLKSNQRHQWNKYIITQLNLSSGEFRLLKNNFKEIHYAANVSCGFKIEYPINRLTNIESSLILGAGYHSGLTNRLSKGISFNESVLVGINHRWKDGLSSQIGLGVVHGSNAGIYPLNRGFNNLILSMGVMWTKKK